MNITRDTITQVLKLARLDLSTEEEEELINELVSILNAFSIINECDVDGIEPSYHPVLIEDVLRDDIPDIYAADNCLKQTVVEGSYIKGPRVI